jgi:phospholipase C
VSAVLDNLKHIVVLMMENRSSDHMLGGLKMQNPTVNGNESNPDTTGAQVQVAPSAKYQGRLANDPDHHFPGVDLQIFGGSQAGDRVPNMQGFVKSHFTQAGGVSKSHAIMSYFTPEQLPMLTTLAT